VSCDRLPGYEIKTNLHLGGFESRPSRFLLTIPFCPFCLKSIVAISGCNFAFSVVNLSEAQSLLCEQTSHAPHKRNSIKTMLKVHQSSHSKIIQIMNTKIHPRRYQVSELHPRPTKCLLKKTRKARYNQNARIFWFLLL